MRNGSHLEPWAERAVVRVGDAMRTQSGWLVEFGDYELMVERGSSRNTTFGGYAATRVDTELPHIRLESQRLRRVRTSAIRRDQRLSLEGDFDRHFQLVCPRGYEPDALYLFPPDVMAVLIDHAADFDIELVDDWVFLSTPRDVITLDPRRWEAVAAAMDAVMQKIGQWERWRDDRVEHNRFTDPGEVAKGGRRLRFGPGSGTMIAVLAGSIFLSLVILANAVN